VLDLIENIFHSEIVCKCHNNSKEKVTNLLNVTFNPNIFVFVLK